MRRVVRAVIKAFLISATAAGILLGAAYMSYLPGKGGAGATPTRPHASGAPKTSAHASSGAGGRGCGTVRIVVLVDNDRLVKGLQTAWGLSIYVETPNTRFLFDTGPDPSVLKHNAEALHINLSSLDFVVISHCHGDHTGGLPLIGEVKPGLKVYVPAPSGLEGYVRSLGLKPVPVSKTVEVAPGVWVIKPLYGPPWEECVAVNTSYGLVVLVGCSHPGVDRMVEQAVKDTGARKVYAVIGGFHLIGAPMSKVAQEVNGLVRLGVAKIYPIHCSGEEVRHYIRTHYPGRLGVGGVGLELDLPAPCGSG